MFAVIHAGGHQHRVEKDSVLRLDRQALEPGAQFETDRVLLISSEGGVKVGAPYVPGARVTGTVLAQGKAKKIDVFKYKSKKNYRRRYGHRSHFTSVRIDDIVA